MAWSGIVRTIPFGSINLQRDHQSEEIMGDLTQVYDKWNPKITGCQEGKQYIEALLAGPRWSVAIPELPKGSTTYSDAFNNPILYDDYEFKLLEVINIKVHDGKAHAYPARYITCGKFEWQADGSIVYFNNTQVNSHIDHAGHPNPLPRVKLSTGHFREIAQKMKGDSAGRNMSFIVGDFNVDQDADMKVNFAGFPHAIFKEFGITTIYEELNTPANFDTDGRRKIDVEASYDGDTRVNANRVERIDTSLLVTDHSAICGYWDIEQL